MRRWYCFIESFFYAMVDMINLLIVFMLSGDKIHTLNKIECGSGGGGFPKHGLSINCIAVVYTVFQL